MIKNLVEKYLEDKEGTYGIYFEDLSNGESFGINEDREFHSASTIKIPLISALFIKSYENNINLDEPINLDEINRVGGAGVIKELNHNFKPTIMDLATLMIILSDNTATNQIIDIVGFSEVEKLNKSLGLEKTSLQRKMMDSKAIEEGKNNYTSPKDMGKILKKLYLGEIYSEELSNNIIDIMKRQQMNNKLPNMIPSLEPDDEEILNKKVRENSVVVAHKTGELDLEQHDVGIFYLPNNRAYILTIFSENLPTDNYGVKVLSEISKIIYDEMS